jgi:hypothetical protein
MTITIKFDNRKFAVYSRRNVCQSKIVKCTCGIIFSFDGITTNNCLSAALHATLGYYLRDAFQEGSADAVACLPVPRAKVFSSFLLLAWWPPLLFLIVKNYVIITNSSDTDTSRALCSCTYGVLK